MIDISTFYFDIEEFKIYDINSYINSLFILSDYQYFTNINNNLIQITKLNCDLLNNNISANNDNDNDNYQFLYNTNQIYISKSISCYSLFNNEYKHSIIKLNEYLYPCLIFSVDDFSKNIFNNITFESDCLAFSSTKHLILQDNIQLMPRSFFGMDELQSVNCISTKLSFLPNECFGSCKKLTNINLPNTLLSIDNITFDNCISLSSIKLPPKVTFIGDMVFNNCSNLISIDLPETLYYIGNYTFNNCKSLSLIIINNNKQIINIDIEQFYQNFNLSIIVPDNLYNFYIDNVKEIKNAKYFFYPKSQLY